MQLEKKKTLIYFRCKFYLVLGFNMFKGLSCDVQCCSVEELDVASACVKADLQLQKIQHVRGCISICLICSKITGDDIWTSILVT